MVIDVDALRELGNKWMCEAGRDELEDFISMELEPLGQALPGEGGKSLESLMSIFSVVLSLAQCQQDINDVRASIKKLKTDFEAIRAYASQLVRAAGPVPEGWRLVPEVPTLEMLRAMEDGFEEDDDGQDYDECYAQAWSGALSAALKVAPQPPAKSPAVAQPVLSDEDAELLRQAKELQDAFTEAVVPREGTLLERMQYLGRYVVALKDAEAKAAVADERSLPKEIQTFPDDDAGRKAFVLGYKAALKDARAGLCQPAEEGGKS